MQASSLGRAEGLDELCSGGGRGRLDGIIDNNSKFIKGKDSASDLDKTSNDDDSLNNSGWGRVGGSNTVFQSINESTPVSNSTNIPSGTAVAHTPGQTHNGASVLGRMLVQSSQALYPRWAEALHLRGPLA